MEKEQNPLVKPAFWFLLNPQDKNELTSYTSPGGLSLIKNNQIKQFEIIINNIISKF